MHDLLFLLFFSLILLPMVELSQTAILRVVFGLLYVALLPGYALIAAVFPGHDDLKWLERLGLSLVLSITMVFLAGFLLDYSPWGIRLTPLLISLNSLILMACIVAYWRRRRLSPEDRLVLRVRPRVPNWQKVDRSNRFLALILTLAVTASIASILYAAIIPGPQETFTEFYVLGPERKFGAYPKTISESESVSVTLGLVNHEHGNIQYRVERVSDTGSEEIASVWLAHEQTWEQPYTLTLTQLGEDQKIEFLLYKGDEAKPYRSLHLWITVREGSTMKYDAVISPGIRAPER